MQDFHARAVFFVSDAERALGFYTETLGFSLDWNYRESGKAFVFQVSLFGLQLILNQTETKTRARAGHGRVFIGLDDEQAERFRRHVDEHDIETSDFHWGNPTLVIHDLDDNELFFWLPEAEDEG